MVLRALALLSLLSLACASETRYVEPAGQDDADLRQAAASEWASVGVVAPGDYTLLFLDAETLAAACDIDLGGMAPDASLGGCSDPGVVLLNQDADFASQLAQLTHELGHQIHSRRGKLIHGHLDCGADANRGAAWGADVMCVTGAEPGTMPTARDAAFVLSR